MNDNHKDLEDKVIMESVLKELRYSALAFSNELGYASHSSIHHILNGRNRISEDMVQRIVKKFPQVSLIYLRSGKGNIILPDKLAQNQLTFKGSSKDKGDEGISYGLESFAVLKSIDLSLKQLVNILENKKSDQD